METKLLGAVLISALLFCNTAQADIWLCLGANDRQSIQDKPCAKGARTKSHVPDTVRHGPISPKTAIAAAREPGKPAIEVGLQRNKVVICNLLNTEKAEALSQIDGSSKPAPGENPKDNLVKIEKQRTRVGCDAG